MSHIRVGTPSAIIGAGKAAPEKGCPPVDLPDHVRTRGLNPLPPRLIPVAHVLALAPSPKGIFTREQQAQI